MYPLAAGGAGELTDLLTARLTEGAWVDAPGTASRALRRSSLAATAVVAFIIVAAIPFAHLTWPQLTGFIWLHVGVIAIADAATAVLLAIEAGAHRSPSVAVLAGGYVFQALVTVVYLGTFPGTIADGSQWIGNPQSPGFVYLMSHVGLLAALALSSGLYLRDLRAPGLRPPHVLAWLAAGVVLALATAAMATRGADALPLFADQASGQTQQFRTGAIGAIAIGLLAIVLTAIAARTGSELRWWALFVGFLATADLGVYLGATAAWQVAWYGPRFLSALAASVLMVLLAADVARRNRTVARLIEQRRAFAEIVAATVEGLLIVDESGTILWNNTESATILGRPGGLKGLLVDELVPRPDRIRHRALREQYTHSPVRRLMGDRTVHAVRGDGSTLPVDITLSPFTTAGSSLTVVSLRDVSVSYAAEQALHAAGELLVEATQHSPIGQARIDLDGILLDVNPAFCRITGQRREDLIGTRELDLVHPVDLAARERYTAALLADPLNHPVLDHRYVTSAGSVAWVRLHGTVIRSASGTPETLVAQVIDITGEKDEQQRRMDAEGRWASVIDNSPVGYLVLDADGRYVEVNAALTQILGYSREELLGQTPAKLRHPDDAARAEDIIADVLSGETTSKKWRMRNVRKDGTVIWVEVRGTALPGPDGTIAAFAGQVVDVSEDVAARQRAEVAEADLLRRSTHDSLTGLLSRSELMTRLTAVLNSPGQGLVAVLYVDVDRFKELNDGISHEAGDEVLVDIGRRLQRTTRDDDLVGRVGGDEFVVALLSLRTTQEALKAAASLQQAISATEVAAGRYRLHVTVSMGMSDSTCGRSAETLLRQADLALNAAKRGGRDRVAMYNEEMRQAAERLLMEANAVRRGIDQGEFRAWFQPIVELRSRSVVGYEALARWLRPDGSVVEAKDFIAVAEEYGLITDIGNRVAAESLALLRVLPEPLTIAINASPYQLASADLVAAVRAEFRTHGTDPRRLILELTEQALLRLSPSAREDLLSLCALGVCLHIDDFGTGYSSMLHLRDYPVSGVKLDREFTADLGDSTETPVGRLAGGISGLASHLNADRVAEGIETEEQAELLQALGFNYGQGFLFGAAEPLRDSPQVPFMGDLPDRLIRGAGTGRRASDHR